MTPDETNLALIGLLDDALKREGITRAELARRLKVTPSYVTRMLSGQRRVTLTFVAQVLDVLDYEVVLIPSRRGST